MLALCPKIASLFVFHSCGYAPPGCLLPDSPELKAIAPLLWNDGTTNDGLGYGPSGLGFLAELQHLIVEPHEKASHNCAHFIIELFLMTSPLLRRIEVKGSLALRDIWDYFMWDEYHMLLTDDVKELVLLRAGCALDDMLSTVMLFPRLVSLHAEYNDPSYRLHPHVNLTFTISSALLRLAETLETLSLTTGPGSYGHWANVEDYPPSLTTLHKMGKIKDLTTESIWLFGREGGSVAFQLPHLLPPNLVRFRLIDYWGTSHEMPPEYLPESLKYHPAFPNQWSTAEFYSNTLMTLVGDNSPPLPDLREVTLVSKHLCEELQAGDSQGDRDQADLTSTAEHLSKLRASFQILGIQFKLEMPVESEATTRAGWARIG